MAEQWTIREAGADAHDLYEGERFQARCRVREVAETIVDAITAARRPEQAGAGVFTITQALSHLVAAGFQSDPSAIHQEMRAAREVLETQADETVYDLIVNACHLEWVAESVADGHGADETVQSTARICLERFRSAREALAQPARGAGETEQILDPREAELLRARTKYPGYNLHAYHGFKAGPLPGCNVMYSDKIPCGAALDEHCHCGDGDHEPLPPEQRDQDQEA